VTATVHVFSHPAELFVGSPRTPRGPLAVSVVELVLA
jgi:hypothetical protein